MGKITGFIEIERRDRPYAPVSERIQFFREFIRGLPDEEMARQGGRCMDCGIPFCQTGCPVNNIIPDWNDLVYRGNWREALDVLHSTNNFPEFTGRVCPAPCEAACVLNINNDPVTIKSIEQAIVDKGWSEGWIGPQVPARKTGKKVAVVGSGPAGLACAQQLARAGHDVTLFEKSDRIGGLLRYGIPDFKMEKQLIDRRMEQMALEGVTFRAGTHIGVTLPASELLERFDALALTGGSEKPRDLPVPGRELAGVMFAMDFLPLQNRKVAGDTLKDQVVATGKHVVVIGGGDTGSDCIGTSFRQGAASVTQLELMPKPALVRLPTNPWPEWPLVLRTSSSQEEGAERDWAISTSRFREEAGRLVALEAIRVTLKGGRPEPIAGTETSIPCDLALLAMGFLGPQRAGLVEQLGLALDGRGNVRTDANGATSVPGVFAAGDASRGQSLVVWAIADGRRVAAGTDAWLRRSTMARAAN